MTGVDVMPTGVNRSESCAGSLGWYVGDVNSTRRKHSELLSYLGGGKVI